MAEVVVFESPRGWEWRIVHNGRTVKASPAWHVSKPSALAVAGLWMDRLGFRDSQLDRKDER
jgi:hypothetical protein